MKKRAYKNLVIVSVILVVIVGIPLILLNYQAKRSGLSMSEVIGRLTSSSDTGNEYNENFGETGKRIDFLDKTAIGMDFTEPPLIAHLQAVDLDDNGFLDVIVCDDRGNFVSWIKQEPEGVYNEIILADDLIAPAHVQVFDFDQDGDKDLMVGVLGQLFPNNDKIGSVVILENTGNFNFRKRHYRRKNSPCFGCSGRRS